MRSITVPFEVLWADVDPLGFIYYPAIFRFVTQAESTLFRLLGFPDARLLDEGYGKPRVHLEVHYHRPLMLHDTGTCTLSVRAVRHSTLHMEFVLQRNGDSEPAVTGQLVCAFISLATRRPTAIPRALREAFCDVPATLARAV